MKGTEFAAVRKKLCKTQKQMAALLGISIKAVHSYEQGWRSIPHHAERHAYFLLSSMKKAGSQNGTPCWEVNRCPEEDKLKCPAWEFQAGEYCWFVNGTFCKGTAHKSWHAKMEDCRNCPVLKKILATEP